MTTPTPAELRELAESMTYIGCSTPHVVTKAMKALRACADVIERMPDVEKLRDLVEQWRADALNIGVPECDEIRDCANQLAALLPDEEPK